MNKRLQFCMASTAFVVSLLSACGGGSTGSSSAVTVSGVAATGAAIAGGTVNLKCAAGAVGAVTTGTDGSFLLDITSATLPCVGRVDYKDASGAAQKLHTFLSQAGVGNITPLTELIVANLTGGPAADAFDQFIAQLPKIKSVTPAQVKISADAVKTFLKATLDVDVSNLPDDPIGTKLLAANGAVKGDKFDAVLDEFQAKLKTFGVKLSDATNYAGKGFPATSSGGSGPVFPVTAVPTTTTTSSSGCPSGGAGTATYSCTALAGAAAITRADADQFVGVYNNGGTDLYVGQGLTLYYAQSSASYAAVSACKQTDGSLYVTYNTAGSNRLVFTQTGAAKIVGGSIPTSPVTPVTNAAQTSCFF